MPLSSRSGIRAVRRAIDALRVLAEMGEPATVTEVAQALGLPVSTTHRILTTLDQASVVEHDPATRCYRIGGGVIRLALGPLAEEDRLRRIARPVLESLHALTGETIHLAVLRGTEVVTIEQIESNHALLVRHPRGTSLPPHATALGKALLAWSPRVAAEVVAAGLPRLTPYTVTDPVTLELELAQIRDRGFAVNERQRQMETAGVAAPVFGARSTPVAAIGVSGPISRIEGELTRFGKAARAAAIDLTDRLRSDERGGVSGDGAATPAQDPRGPTGTKRASSS